MSVRHKVDRKNQLWAARKVTLNIACARRKFVIVRTNVHVDLRTYVHLKPLLNACRNRSDVSYKADDFFCNDVSVGVHYRDISVSAEDM